MTLLTDFGTRDGFVAAMKGVILTRASEAQVFDVTHDICPQEVREAAWVLRNAAPWYPEGTIHVVVVDPGVGSARQALLLEGKGHFFIGPDNGVLSLAVPQPAGIWRLDKPQWFLPDPSHTFHGRDIFASVAGYLVSGVSPSELGTATASWQRILEPEPVMAERGIRGEVLHIDRFGNLITNITKEALNAWRLSLQADKGLQVIVNDMPVGNLHQTFADVAMGAWVAYIGSSGRVEIGVRNGSAAAAGFARGDRVGVCVSDM